MARSGSALTTQSCWALPQTDAVFGVLGSILIQKQGQESFSNFLSCVFVGVDEVTIINILTNRNNEQRQDIAFAYQRRTKKVDMKR